MSEENNPKPEQAEEQASSEEVTKTAITLMIGDNVRDENVEGKTWADVKAELGINARVYFNSNELTPETPITADMVIVASRDSSNGY